MKGRWLLLVLMFAVGLLFVAPMVLMVLTSFKPEAEVLNPESAIPKHWTLQNYLDVLNWSEEAPFVRWLMNSILVSSSVTFLVLVLSSLAAFGITRVRVPGAGAFFYLVVASMMVPGLLFLVPVYFILNSLHLLDTPAALVLPAAGGGFGVFLLTQFMRSLPKAIEEAALIDGCSWLGVYYHVSLPLCAPAMATLGVLTFIGSWNDFVGPLVYLDSIQNYTLPVGIALYQASYYTEYGRTLATSAMATAPLLLIFAIFQRQIVESMSSTGLKD